MKNSQVKLHKNELILTKDTVYLCSNVTCHVSKVTNSTTVASMSDSKIIDLSCCSGNLIYAP